MRTYQTTEGDMLDLIAHKVYGDATLVPMILDANPGLVEQPLILPHGVTIVLPDLPVKQVPSAINDIWG